MERGGGVVVAKRPAQDSARNRGFSWTKIEIIEERPANGKCVLKLGGRRVCEAELCDTATRAVIV